MIAQEQPRSPIVDSHARHAPSPPTTSRSSRSTPQRSFTADNAAAHYGNAPGAWAGVQSNSARSSRNGSDEMIRPPRAAFTMQHGNHSTPSLGSGDAPYAAPSLSPDDLHLDRMRIAEDDPSGAPWQPEVQSFLPPVRRTRTSTSSASSADRERWRGSQGSFEGGGEDPYGGMAGDEGDYSRTPIASSSHLRTNSGSTLNAGYFGPPPQQPMYEGGYGMEGGAYPPPQDGYYGAQAAYQGQPYDARYGGYPQQPAAFEQNPYYASSGIAFPPGQAVPPQQVYAMPPGVSPYGLSRNASMASQLTTGSATSLHRVPSAMPGGGERRKAVANPTGRERTPITKAAIDEYRNRIKADPDPESQFNFAKYLIEAARKLAQSTAHAEDSSSTRNVKKYRDALLQESIKLIKRLATQGSGLGKPAYADAQFFLADCLSSGSLGLQVDHEKAYNLYVQASKQNHAPATYRTAVCNEGGHGTRKDPGRAVLFYRKASALGNTPGMYKLGMICLNGLLGQPKNGKEAVTWLRRAASQADAENPHALHELGALYEKPPNPTAQTGPGPTVMVDLPQAFELYQQAAKLGYGLSQYKLGMAFEYGNLGCPVDPRRSVAYYTRAAERNVADAELALSGWYLTGAEAVLQQSDTEAYLWARRAANRGLPRGEFAVGYYEEAGIGCKRDIEEAKRWYMRAAAQGNKRAMQRLTELKKQNNARVSKKPTRQQAQAECIIS